MAERVIWSVLLGVSLSAGYALHREVGDLRRDIARHDVALKRHQRHIKTLTRGDVTTAKIAERLHARILYLEERK